MGSLMQFVRKAADSRLHHDKMLRMTAFSPLEFFLRLLAAGLLTATMPPNGMGANPDESLGAPESVYVDDDAAHDPGAHDPALSDPLEDGSQEHPFDSIQEAIQAIAPGGQVHVAEGTYREALTISKDLTLFGGYGADWWQELSREPHEYPTIVDAAGHNTSAVRILNADVTIDGFTITHGKAPVGGGVSCSGGAHTIRACTILDNRTWDGGSIKFGGDGGGVYASSASVLILEDCVISGNRTGNGGAGLGASQAGRGGSGAGVYSAHDLTVEDCVITGNIAGDGGNGPWAGGMGGSGGGIYSSGTRLAVKDSLIADNLTGKGGNGAAPGASYQTPGSFGGYGGGILSSCDRTEIVGSEIYRNATGSGGDTSQDGQRCGPGGNGGGICCMSSTATIVDCTIWRNAAGDGPPKNWGPGGGGNGGEGGGLYFDLSSVSMSDCQIDINLTGAGGDGVYEEQDGQSEYGSAGDAGRGGGLCILTSTIEISACRFLANATASGGGGHLGMASGGNGGNGGAIYTQSSTVAIDESEFYWNLTGAGGSKDLYYGKGGDAGNGGALCLQTDCVVEMAGCTFGNNGTGRGGDGDPGPDGYGGTGGQGGAVYCESSTLGARLCSFTENTTGDGGTPGLHPARSAGDGGGLCAQSSSVDLTECAFTANVTGRAGAYRYARPSGHGGAACFLDGGTITLDKCLIRQNQTGDGIWGGRMPGRSGSGGGLFFDSCATVQVHRCIVAQNSTGDVSGSGEYGDRTGDGGGLSILDSPARIENCLIYGNLTGDGIDGEYEGNGSGHGGAIYCPDDPEVVIVGCTIAGNECGLASAGTGWIEEGTRGRGGGVYGCATTILVNSILWANVEDDAAGCDTNLVSYCAVADSTLNGINHNLSANPRFADMSGGDYRLQPDSPCIDRGNNAAVSLDSTSDLAGNPRVVGPAVDMGAYEWSATWQP